MWFAKAFALLVVACFAGCGGGAGVSDTGAVARAVGDPCSLAAGQGWCWQHSYATQDTSFWYIWMLDEARGLVTAQDGVLRVTDDGGHQWREQVLPGAPIYGGGLHFTADGTGFAVAQDRLHRSVDGGRSWQVLDLPGISGGVRWAQFIDSVHGWLLTWICRGDGDVVFCTATLYATEDGGVSWQARGPIHESAVVRFADLNVGVKSDFTGLSRTTDGGRTWSAITTGRPAAASARNIYFRTSREGWLLGFAAQPVLLHTDDAGLTWNEVPLPSSTPAQLYDIRFADARNGWITGVNGTVLRTSDSGSSWRRQPTGTTLALFAVFPLDAQHVWVIGAMGSILATSTGGE